MGQTRTLAARSKTASSPLSGPAAAAAGCSAGSGALAAGFVPSVFGISVCVATERAGSLSASFSASAPDRNSQPDTPTAQMHSARTM